MLLNISTIKSSVLSINSTIKSSEGKPDSGDEQCYTLVSLRSPLSTHGLATDALDCAEVRAMLSRRFLFDVVHVLSIKSGTMILSASARVAVVMHRCRTVGPSLGSSVTINTEGHNIHLFAAFSNAHSDCSSLYISIGEQKWL